MEAPKYDILDKVFHILPDSPSGIVIDIRYQYSTRRHEYQVSFAHDTVALWYFDYELTTQKRYE